jgi:hypothetical protein
MKLEEMIFNLLGMSRKRKIKLTSDNWDGEILIKGSKIIHSSVNLASGEKIEGIEALRFIIENQDTVNVVDFLPFDNGKETLRINQMEFLSLLSPEFSKGFEDINQFELEEGTVPTKIYDVCKKYFDRRNIRFVITEKSEKDEVLKNLESLIYEVKENLCKKGEMVLSFAEMFFLIFFYEEKLTVVALDSKELPNFKLYEPQIMSEILEVLSEEA